MNSQQQPRGEPPGNKDVFISMSIGVFLGSAADTDVDTVLRNADIALYRAKSNGKAIYSNPF